MILKGANEQDYDDPVDLTTELDAAEDGIAAEAEWERLHEELQCPECEDDCGCEKCFFTGEIADSRECEHGTGDWRGCKECNPDGWRPGDSTECEHGNLYNHCEECIHEGFIRDLVLSGDCFDCNTGKLGADHVCTKCGWDGKPYLRRRRREGYGLIVTVEDVKKL